MKQDREPMDPRLADRAAVVPRPHIDPLVSVLLPAAFAVSGGTYQRLVPWRTSEGQGKASPGGDNA